MADFLHYDYNPDQCDRDTEDEIPDDDYYVDDDELDELLDDLEDAEEGEDIPFLELDDEFDTKDDDLESKRWNKRPKKGYREDDE